MPAQNSNSESTIVSPQPSSLHKRSNTNSTTESFRTTRTAVPPTRSKLLSIYPMAFGVQVEALIRKHVFTVLNTPFLLFVTMITPLLCVILTAVAFNLLSDQALGTEGNTEPVALQLSQCSGQLADCSARVYYTPTDEYHDEVMERAMSLAGFEDPDLVLVPFETRMEMWEESVERAISNNRRTLFAAVNFNTFGNDFVSVEDAGNRLEEDQISAYTITSTSALAYDGLFPLNYYITDGKLMALKQAIDLAIMVLRKESQGQQVSNPQITAEFQAFPFVAQSPEDQASQDQRVLAQVRRESNRLANLLTRMLLTVSYFPQVLLFVGLLSYDKHNGMLGPLRKMGMKEGAYWMSVLIIVTIVTTANTAVSLIGYASFQSYNVYETVGSDLIFLSMWLFGIAFTMFGNMLVAAVSRPYASTVLTIVYLVCVGVFQVIPVFLPAAVETAQNWWWSAWLFPGIAQFFLFIMPWFHFAKIVSDFLAKTDDNINENTIERYTYDNADEPFALDNRGNTAPSTRESFGWLIMTIIILYILNWYLNQVVAGPSGSGKKPWFFLLPSYWGVRTMTSRGDKKARSASKSNQSVIVSRLSKTYGSFRAVNGVSMTIEKGRVIALLGHNGAGKSTLINMLSGLTAPSSGDAYVFGKTLTRDMERIQTDLGVCPQDDFLWEKLSAYEHIRLYARFKNIPLASVDQYISERLSIVGLQRFAKKKVGKFSGGMKRRVSILLASVGNPRFVVLDEPTTGMDPINRRKVWQFVESLKEHSSMLLTTHSMEEADHLGDEVVIMDHGKVKASGTSLALKNKYGKGYQVNILARPDMEKHVEDLIEAMLPESEIVASGSGSITVAVPKHAITQLPAFFRYIANAEAENAAQGYPALIREWGVQNTSLEQVFLRLAGSAAKIDQGITGQGGRKGLFGRKNKAILADDDAGEIQPPNFSSRVKFTSALRAVILKNLTFQMKQWKANVLLMLVLAAAVATIHALLPVLITNELCMDGRQASYTPLSGRRTCNVEAIANDLEERSQQCGTSFEASLQCTGRDFSVGKYSNLVNNPEPRVWFSEGDVQSPLREEADRAAETASEVLSLALGALGSSDLDDVNTEAASISEPPDTSVSISNLVRQNQEFVRDQSGPIPVPACDGENGYFVDSHSQSEEEYVQRFPDVGFEVLESNTDELQLHYRVSYWPPDIPQNAALNTRIYFNADQPRCIYVGLIQYEPPVTAAYQQFLQETTPEDVSFRIMQQSMMNAFSRAAFGEEEALLTNYVELVVASPLLGNFITAILVLTAMFALFPIFIIVPYVEKDEGLYSYLRVNGVSLWVYWLGTYLYDLLIGIPAVLISMIALVTFYSYINVGIYLVSGFLVVHATIGMAFLFAAVFKSSALSRLLSYVLPFAFSLSGSLIVFMDVLQQPPFVTPATALYPPAAFAFILRMILEAEYEAGPYATACILLVVTGFIFIGISVLIAWMKDSGNTLPVLFNKYIVRKKAAPDPNVTVSDMEDGEGGPDEDVIAHSNFVNDQAKGTIISRKGRKLDTGSVLAVHTDDLRKTFGHTKIVRGISMGVQTGEAFGLLGPNGAGKTTTLNMLMGQTKPTRGSALVGGYQVGDARLSNVLGVCPQFDKVFRELTVEENLLFFARVRGASGKGARKLAKSAAQMVGLGTAAYQRRAENLSGGMRRRLSIAIALLGLPTVIYLDEPTTGLDPSNRLHIWKVVSTVKEQQDVAIIITTHSMEEADALCTRIGIMAAGKLRALGSQVHLKNKFGSGYRLTVQIEVLASLQESTMVDRRLLQRQSTEDPLTLNRIVKAIPVERAIFAEKSALGEVDGFVMSEISPHARSSFEILEKDTTKRITHITVDESGMWARWSISNVHYFLPPDVDLASVFESMTKSVHKLNIIEWGLNQSTLEDVFVRVASAYVD